MQTAPLANYLLFTAYAEKNDDDLTPLRVQKLLYFLHGWYMAVTGTALFTEPFVHGKFGPKLVSLDVTLAQYAGVPVGDYIKDWNPDKEKFEALFVNTKALPQFVAVFEKVWKEYSKFSTPQLSTLSHGPESPWARTQEDDDIPNTWIVNEFLRLGVANRERASASKKV